MDFATTWELLNALLEGYRLSPQDIDVLRKWDEDAFLDFKHGSIADRSKKNKAVFREYVSAFANAQGGVLVVGVDDRSRDISPCQQPAQITLTDWTMRLVRDLSQHLESPPRVQEVAHPSGLVLVIAVPRAPQLVPVSVEGQIAYFVRLHDEVYRIPDWLLSDLFLGRRQIPVLRVEGRLAIPVVSSASSQIGVRFYFEVFNEGMSVANDVVVGLVCWNRRPSEVYVTPQLRHHLDIQEPSGTGWSLHHGIITPGNQPILRIRPFGKSDRALLLENWTFPAHGPPLVVKAAVYVLAENAMPQWFELEFELNPGLLKHDRNIDCETKSVAGDRARVAIIEKGSGNSA